MCRELAAGCYNADMSSPTQFEAKTPLDKFFQAGILLKAIDGLLEIIGGVLLLFVKPAYLDQFAVTLTQHELVEDPHDFVVSHLVMILQAGKGSLLFGAVYLVTHGLVKILLVSEILRGRLWAYQGLIWFTVGFMVYQTYRFAYSGSVLMIVLTLYDAVVVWLTVVEYRKRRGDRQAGETQAV